MERKGLGGPAENPVNGQVGGETIQESLLLRPWNCPGCSRVTVLVTYCLSNAVQQQTTKSHWHKHFIFPQASEFRWLCFKLQMCCGGLCSMVSLWGPHWRGYSYSGFFSRWWQRHKRTSPPAWAHCRPLLPSCSPTTHWPIKQVIQPSPKSRSRDIIPSTMTLWQGYECKILLKKLKNWGQRLKDTLHWEHPLPNAMLPMDPTSSSLKK